MSAEFSEAIAPWIAEYCAAQAAERTARAERREADREAKRKARDAGLIQRYARKAARIKTQASITYSRPA